MPTVLSSRKLHYTVEQNYLMTVRKYWEQEIGYSRLSLVLYMSLACYVNRMRSKIKLTVTHSC